MRLILDLDNTLYPAKCNLIRDIETRISQFVALKLNLDFDEGDRLRREYFIKYGTTVTGMKVLYDVPPAEFYEYTHQIDIHDYISTDEALRATLQRIGIPMSVFTNSPLSYATQVLEVLGIDDLMDGVYCIEFSEFISKPTPLGYEKLHRELSLGETGAIMVDDQPRNLVPGVKLGWKAIRYNEDGMREPDERFVEITTLDELPEAIERVTD